MTSSLDIPKPYDVVLGGNNPIVAISSPEAQAISKTATKPRNTLSAGFNLLFRLLGWIIKTTLVILLATITALLVLASVCAVCFIAIAVLFLVVFLCYAITLDMPFGFWVLISFIGLTYLWIKSLFQN